MAEQHPLHSAAISNVKFSVSAQCPAYLSPVNTTSDLGLVVIQEWWGMNVSITKTADDFAALGFRALVPDLYRGKVAKDGEHAGHLMSGLDWGQAVEDIRGAVKYLKAEGCKKVGVVGFCMGGALVIVSCANVPEIDAGMAFYGVPDLANLNAKNVKMPMLAFFGKNDEYKGFADQEAAAKLDKWFKDNGIKGEVISFDNIGHAFMNRDRPEKYSPELAAQCKERCAAFMKSL